MLIVPGQKSFSTFVGEGEGRRLGTGYILIALSRALNAESNAKWGRRVYIPKDGIAGREREAGRPAAPSSFLHAPHILQQLKTLKFLLSIAQVPTDAPCYRKFFAN